MDQPESKKEEPTEQIITPSEVWERLSPDLQASICSLLARMAYKYALAQCGLSSEDAEVRSDIQRREP